VSGADDKKKEGQSTPPETRLYSTPGVDPIGAGNRIDLFIDETGLARFTSDDRDANNTDQEIRPLSRRKP